MFYYEHVECLDSFVPIPFNMSQSKGKYTNPANRQELLHAKVNDPS